MKGGGRKKQKNEEIRGTHAPDIRSAKCAHFSAGLWPVGSASAGRNAPALALKRPTPGLLRRHLRVEQDQQKKTFVFKRITTSAGSRP